MALMPIAELSSYHRNPRRGDVDTIAESLEKLGQYRPIVVNKGTHTGRPMEVLAGNHTMAAARKLGWDEIDVHLVDVDDDTAARIVLVDNRSNDVAEYDNTELLKMLAELPDLSATGFKVADVDSLRDEIAADMETELSDQDDSVPDVPRTPIARKGDVFTLGKHRVICGDATDPRVYKRLMGDERADVMWTDPPYGVEYVGKTKDALRIQNDGAAGLDPLLRAAFGACIDAIRPGGAVYVAHSDTERVTFETTMRAAGFDVRQNLLWVKNTMVLGRSDYHYQHEPVLYGNVPEGEQLDGIDHYEPDHEPILYGFTPGGKGRLGRGGPRWYGDNAQTTVFLVDKPPANKQHPTMKPVALITAMLDNSLRRGGIVLDPFGGSGSTLIAADAHGSQARVIELDPKYVDVICRRWQERTELFPVRHDGEEIDFTEQE